MFEDSSNVCKLIYFEILSVAIEAQVKMCSFAENFTCLFCQAVRALQTQNHFKFWAWGFFYAHVWDIISEWAQPQIGDGCPPCLFLLVAFFQFSHFSSSASGNPSFMYFQSKLPALLHSTPILCTLLSHQGLADVTRQTPTPAGIFLEWSFLLLSDNFPSFSDIAMSLKRKMLFVFHPAF